MRKIVSRAVLAWAVLIVYSGCAWSQAVSPMAWPTVRAQLEQHWKTTYPSEKLLRIEPKGGVQYYGSERRTETDSWGWFWETRTIETQGAFARQVALVTAERANKTQARFEVAALFQKNGNAWGFRQIALGKVEELSPAPAGGLPSGAEASAIFNAAWKKLRPDFEVQSVEVLGSEPKQYQERRWINYRLAIIATGTDKGSREMYQKRYRCTPADYSSVLKLESGGWVPDEKMIRDVNESRDCSLAR